MYSFQPDNNFLHTKFAIENNRYFADFFVGECRKNDFKFSSYEEETSQIIENWETVATTDYYGTVYAFK